jgi:hypothetical protein
MIEMYRKPIPVLAACLVLLCFADPGELNAAQDIARLAQECRQGGQKSCEELAKIATNAKDSTLRVSAVGGINDQSALSKIATTDPSASVRRSAVIRLSDQDALRVVATSDKDSDVRAEAVSRLRDPPALTQIAKTDRNAMVRLAAVDRIEDQTVLKEISTSDPDSSIRGAARRKISDPAMKPQRATRGQNDVGATGAQRLTVDDVLKLKRDGAADDLIVDKISKSAPGYDLSKSDLVRLFDGGLSTDVIRAMVQRSEQPAGRSDIANGDEQAGIDVGDNPRIVYLPAIGYGSGQWSVVKIANSGEERTPVRLEVYRSDGSTHPASSEFMVEPNGEKEIRIEGAPTGYLEPRTSAWVRVAYPEQARNLTITTSMELLDDKDKNVLHSVPREPATLEDPPRTVWIYKTGDLRNQLLYILNVGDEEASVRLCQGNDARRLCPPGAMELHAEGRTSMEKTGMDGLQSAFLIIQTEQESKLLVMFLTPSSGDLKKFKTDSKIIFDPPLP